VAVAALASSPTSAVTIAAYAAAVELNTGSVGGFGDGFGLSFGTAAGPGNVIATLAPTVGLAALSGSGISTASLTVQLGLAELQTT
jgi:hypothetical protein